jgi:thymidylate synthase (FAD)
LKNLDIPENANFYLDDGLAFVSLIQHVGDDAGVANSARVSFGKRITEVDGKDKKLIKYLLAHQHGTPFESNSLTFHIKAPIFISRQHFRHRISSFSEISGRYVEMKDEFYIPTKFRKQSPSNRQASIDEFVGEATEFNDLNPAATTVRQGYRDVLELAYRNYTKLLEAGVSREQARGVLPLCTYTQYYWTCNLRSFLHFIGLRLHEGAQFEIRMLAEAMLKQVEPIFPVSIAAWKELRQ